MEICKMKIIPPTLQTFPGPLLCMTYALINPPGSSNGCSGQTVMKFKCVTTWVQDWIWLLSKLSSLVLFVSAEVCRLYRYGWLICIKRKQPILYMHGVFILCMVS